MRNRLAAVVALSVAAFTATATPAPGAPRLEAYFTRWSHSVEQRAKLEVSGGARLAVRIYRAGPENGAKVFDAGAMNFGGTADPPTVRQLITNLWERLSRP
jgi:hypothetical protein